MSHVDGKNRNELLAMAKENSEDRRGFCYIFRIINFKFIYQASWFLKDHVDCWLRVSLCY